MNNTTSYPLEDVEGLHTKIQTSYFVLAPLYILVSIGAGGWLVSAILTSTEMRQRLRNWLVCSFTTGDFLKASICQILNMIRVVMLVTHKSFMPCHYLSFMIYSRLILEFITSWYIVILIIVFIAQIVEYDLPSTLTPLALRWGKIAVLVVPAVLGTILIPAIGTLYNRVSITRNECIYTIIKKHLLVFGILDYMVPLSIGMVLLIVASVLYYRRFHRGVSSTQTIRPELLNAGSRIDSFAAYIGILGIDFVSRLAYTILVALEVNGSIGQRILYNYIAWIIVDVGALLRPFVWLFLEDIMDRIKVWRPWYRPGPGIDVAVTYNKKDYVYE